MPTTAPKAAPVDPMVTFVLLLVQVPSGVASLRLVVRPKQTFRLPAIDNGNGLTVTVVAIRQPVGNMYAILAFPAVRPPIKQPSVPMLAVPSALLLQKPPGVASDKQSCRPLHTGTLPVIGAGRGLTVRMMLEVVVPQELFTFHVMVEFPAATVVTMPVTGSMVATPVLLLLQPVPVPTGVVLKNVVVPFKQMVAFPVMAAAAVSTFTRLEVSAALLQPVPG